MNFLIRTLIVASLALAGCAQKAEAPKAADMPTGGTATKTNLQLTMVTKVNPQGLAFWDITNKAMDNSGQVDASKLTPQEWTQLLEIGTAIDEGGQALATTNGIIAAAPGVKLQDEGAGGASTAADVQRFVDAQPEVFRSHAQELQQTGASIVKAATEKDGKKLSELSDSLDMICESCHVIFWYPQQKKLP